MTHSPLGRAGAQLAATTPARGPLRAAAWFAARAAARLYRREQHLLILRRLESRPEPLRPPEGVEYRRLGECAPEAVLAFSRRNRFPRRSLRPVRYGLDHYDGLAAIREGRIVAIYWWAEAAALHPDVALHGLELEEGDAYGFWLYVAAEERPRRTTAAFLDAVAHAAQGQGFRRLVGFVLEPNIRARWFFSFADYEQLGCVPVRFVLGLLAVSPTGLFVRRTRHGDGPPFGYRPLASYRPRP